MHILRCVDDEGVLVILDGGGFVAIFDPLIGLNKRDDEVFEFLRALRLEWDVAAVESGARGVVCAGDGEWA